MSAFQNDKQRIPVLTITALVVCATVVIVMTATLLYRHNFTEHVHNLETMVEAQAQLVASVARYDAQNTSVSAWEATLGQVEEAYERLGGFGNSGEFLVARRAGENYEYLTALRFPAERIAGQRGAADDALLGALPDTSGWMVTTDYRGRRVLAAYRPISELGVALVAKIDLREIRAPFIRTAAMAAFAALLVTVIGGYFVSRATGRIVDRVHHSEQRLQLAMASTNSGLWDLNAVTGDIYFNEQWMTMLGYEHFELPHNYATWKSLLHPEDAAGAEQYYLDYTERARQDKSAVYDQEYRMRAKDGSYRLVQDRGEIVEWDGETPLRFIGTHFDITDRRQSEQRLRLAVETSDMGFWDFNMLTAQMVFSDTCPSTIGHDGPDEFPDSFESHMATVHPDDIGRVRRFIEAYIERALADRTAIYEQEFRVRDGNGTYRWLADRGRIIEWDGDQPVRAIGTHTDITERKENEETLHRTQQLIQGVIDSANALVYVKDLTGAYLLVNRQWQEYCGKSAQESLGRKDDVLFPPEIAAGFMENDVKVRDSREELQFEESILLHGEPRTLVSLKFPLFDTRGELFATAGISTDVTHLKNIEQELREARAEAEQANRSKSDFLANMSHEIRTPMNGIMGMTELAMDTELSREQREYLQTIESSAQSLLSLIDDILDFSKIEAQKLTLDPVDFDLRERLGETLDTLAARAHGKGLELAFDIDPDVPDMLVGDVHRLRQIVINLIGNALKFTESGEVVVRVGIEAETESSVVAHFQVSDTGIGIPAERLDKVFESFEQADTSTTRQYGGTGLGLTICSRLTELMGGRIWVESTPGLGLTFHFTAALGRSKEHKRGASHALTGQLDGLNVLVVDDNATNRRILEKMLGNWRMNAVLAAGAKAGLEALQSASANTRPFDVLITDVHMPEMDGYEFVQAIRDDPVIAGIPVIMLSSARRSEDAERARDLGITENLLKPAKQSRILDAVITAVGVDTVTAKHDPAKVAEAPADHAPLHVLVAEDNEVNQKFAVRVLTKAGHTSVIANNGREAVAAFERERFDVILMDVQMPEMDGYEATAAVRGREIATGRCIPIIALTAHAMKGDREKCIAAGMNGYVTKPVKSKALLGEIARLTTPGETAA